MRYHPGQHQWRAFERLEAENEKLREEIELLRKLLRLSRDAGWPEEDKIVPRQDTLGRLAARKEVT